MRTAPSKAPMAISKRAIHDALLMRGSPDFPDLDAYRHFVDEIVSRRNNRNAKRIDAERPTCSRCPSGGHLTYEEDQRAPSPPPAASPCAKSSTPSPHV